jgi:hypothetical protein
MLCLPCFSTLQKIVNVSSITKRSSSDSYATFAKLEDTISNEYLFKQMNWSGVDIAKVNIEHAFISNFEEDTMTAQIHANCMTSSMAIQYIGSKTWLFLVLMLF